MPRTYGEEYPERSLMGVLSDLAGIKHFTTARGSTVRRDFLEALARALGLPPATVSAMPTKDDVLALVVEQATRAPMDPDWFSPGGTVTNEVLQVIIDGIAANGVPGRYFPDSVPVSGVWDSGYGEQEFDPADLADERDRRLVEIAAREGQDRFRSALLEAYDGKCAITGYDAPETLEAAHIYPYRGPATNRVSNGLLLRADIHTLFDRGALAVHETSHEVMVKPHLLVTSYAWLSEDACRFRQPRHRSDRPSTAALRSHRLWSGM